MMLEWIWTCFYFVSAFLLFLAIKNLRQLLRLNWKTPFNTLKVAFYLTLSFFIFVSVQELSDFYSSAKREAILQIQIEKLDHQMYQISLLPSSKNSQQEKQRYLVYGDMWQVDLKVLSWNKIISYLGIDTLYSLDRLNGRYKDIEDELTKERSIYSLKSDSINDIAWPYALVLLEITLVRSFYGASVYAPMANQAEFSVYLTNTGIELNADNEEATLALKRWK